MHVLGRSQNRRQRVTGMRNRASREVINIRHFGVARGGRVNESRHVGRAFEAGTYHRHTAGLRHRRGDVTADLAWLAEKTAYQSAQRINDAGFGGVNGFWCEVFVFQLAPIIG